MDEQEPLLTPAEPRIKIVPKTILKLVGVAVVGFALMLAFVWHSTPTKSDGLEWSKCGDLQCATLMVPMNHLDPNSKLIGVALNKYPAKIQPAKKSMLVNPGGPGGSGKQTVARTGAALSLILDHKVDIIGFDPRSVGDTQPLNCFNDKQSGVILERAKIFNRPFVPKNASDEQIAVFDSHINLMADLCAENTGEFLSYTSTANVARDMDLIRKALGMDKMNYWGFSYGSILGATYANMFPENVGNMILDGVVNPNHYTGDIYDFLSNDLRDTTSTLKAISKLCDQSPSCPLFAKNKSSLKRILSLIEKLRKKPLIVKDSLAPGVLTAEAVEEHVFRGLYSPMIWKNLTAGIVSAEGGNGKLLYEFNPSYLPQTCGTKDSNVFGIAFGLSAILCADTADKSHKFTVDEWMQFISDTIKKTTPLAGHQWGSLFWPCLHWKRFEGQERYHGPWNASFANPLLLVGNTFDPVTPLISAKETVDLMHRNDKTNAVLLTHDGTGHCSTAQPSKCTAAYIRDYILNGVLPPQGTVCVADSELFPTDSLTRKVDPVIDALTLINEAINWNPYFSQ